MKLARTWMSMFAGLSLSAFLVGCGTATEEVIPIEEDTAVIVTEPAADATVAPADETPVVEPVDETPAADATITPDAVPDLSEPVAEPPAADEAPAIEPPAADEAPVAEPAATDEGK